MKHLKISLCVLMALVIGLTVMLSGCTNQTGGGGSMNGTKVAALAEPTMPKGSTSERPALDPNFVSAVVDFCADSTALATNLGEGNLAFSPVSLYMALAMSSMGAEGETLNEMLKAFHMEAMDKETIAEESKKLFESIYFDTETGKTYLANSIWIDDQLTVKEDFYRLTAQNFFAPAYNVDLQAPAVQKSISNWVDEQTNGKVSRPVPEEVSPDLVMSLINAIYFIDRWQNQFDPEMTESGSFTLENGEEVEADFMNQRLNGASYGKTNDYESVTMPFVNGYAMTFYLPAAGRTASELLTEKLIFGDHSMSNDMRMVDISLPKFDIESTLDLTQLLSEMGMASAVNGQLADFAGISDQSTYISSVAQSAAVTVDETGCEAAAYTEITMEATGIWDDSDVVEFILNRPFAFTITDTNNIPLFTGLVNNPAA